MSYRLRLKIMNQQEEHKVLVSFDESKLCFIVRFEASDMTLEYGSANEVFQALAQFCFSGQITN